MKTITRIEAIQALKKKFFNTNPESWSDNSNDTLLGWYKEYILEDMNANIAIR